MRSRWALLLAVMCSVACGEREPELADLVHIIDATPERIVATITQPRDHARPQGPTFEQRLVIYPAAMADAPVVVDVEGYELGDGTGAHEVTNIVAGTEVQIEHRFFGASLLDDWSLLTTAQSAADVHYVIDRLRVFYGGQWLSTGISKGGVEALYHRELYTDDVSGTVVYVAPASLSTRDERYAIWVASLGDRACRDAMIAFERLALTEPKRSLLADAIADYLAGHALTVLGADRILELTVRETPFTFWQYGDASRCAIIPTETSSAADVVAFLDATNGLAGWSDEGLAAEQGYWYAAATELGYPADDHAVVADLVRYLEPPTPVQATTRATPAFDERPLADLSAWMATAADRVILVYGELDGWTGGAFSELAPGVDEHLVRGGNHRSRLRNLPDDERADVAAKISHWTSN